MALSDKDLIITPNRGQSDDPKIEFIGADSVTGPQTITLSIAPENDGTLSFDGSAGQLFSLTNDNEGVIFSVNDSNGTPSIEVLDDGTIYLAEFDGDVFVGKNKIPEILVDDLPTIRPSLLLDFANSKQLDPRIDFTRSSTGTYYDGKTVAVAEQNLYRYSQDFDRGWSKPRTGVESNVETAPDGTMTADKLVPIATTDERSYAYQSLGSPYFNTTATFPFSVFSVYAKADEYVSFFTVGGGYGDGNWVRFDLDTGTVGYVNKADIVGTIEDVGNGWYRCQMYLGPNSGEFFRPTIQPSTDKRTNPDAAMSPAFDGVSGMFFWGAQYELDREVATAYTPTTDKAITNYIPVLQTATANTPRFDHDPATGESLGLLVEEQRTNLFQRSEEFDQSPWSGINFSITANQTTAPDGTITADLYTANAATTADFRLTQGATSSSLTNTVSCFLKEGTAQYAYVALVQGNDGTRWAAAVVDMSNGTITQTSNGVNTSGISSSISSVGNGWYRVSVTATVTGGSSFSIRIAYVNTSTPTFGTYAQLSSNITAVGTESFYVWGAQLEDGAFPTSYIKTEASQVTRAAEAQEIPNEGKFGEGTLYIEADVQSGDNLFASGVNINTTTFSATATENQKTAIAYDAVDNRTSINGGTVTSSGPTGEGDDLKIGVNATGHIKKIAKYPQKLSDTNLVAITSG